MGFGSSTRRRAGDRSHLIFRFLRSDTATASDILGNTTNTEITVIKGPLNGPQVLVVSGDRQIAHADFEWAMSVASELSKGDVPPKNPFMSGDRMHYYWLAGLFGGVPLKPARGVPPYSPMLVSAVGPSRWQSWAR